MVMDDEMQPDSEVPFAELMTLGALGTALYGDLWISQLAESLGVSKGHLSKLLRNKIDLTPALRRRVVEWAGRECREDLRRALSRIDLYEAVEAAFAPKD